MVWAVQFAPATVLAKRGWTDQTFKPGDAVVATGHPSRAPGHVWARAARHRARRRQVRSCPVSAACAAVPARRLTPRGGRPYRQLIELDDGVSICVCRESCAADGSDGSAAACLSGPTRSSAFIRCRRTTSSGIGVRSVPSGEFGHAGHRGQRRRGRLSLRSRRAEFTRRAPLTPPQISEFEMDAQPAARLHLCRERGDELPRARALPRLGGARLQEVQTRGHPSLPKRAPSARARHARRCCASSSAAARASNERRLTASLHERAAPLPGEAGLHFDSLPPLSLYVHLPWCVRKCPYCDFNSYEARGALPDVEYVDALLRDLRGELPFVQEPQRRRRCSWAAARRACSPARRSRGCSHGLRAELTLAPARRDHARGEPRRRGRRTVRARFARRASIVCRSVFRASATSSCARSAECTTRLRRALPSRRRARPGSTTSTSTSCTRLPNDDVAGAVADLEGALELAPSTLSWYQLTLEPNTAFERRPPALPDDEVVRESRSGGVRCSRRTATRRYEISAYARPGRRCLHNLNYWQFGDYLGLGAGAHGKVTLRSAGEIARRAKTRNPRTYHAASGSGGLGRLTNASRTRSRRRSSSS